MTGARMVARMLQAHGVDHVFFMDAILRRALAEMEDCGIRRILGHSEKAVAYMADGYARIAGRPGVCMAQSVGAANLASGLQDPWLGQSAVIALTGRHVAPFQYRNAYQEVEHAPLFAPVTKFSGRADTLEQIPHLLRMAFREATSGTPRPVHLDIAGFTGDTPDFARTADICAGFFQHFLGVDDGGMERCIGPAVFADPTLVTHEQTVVESRIWLAAPPRIGQLTRVSVAAASGSLAILVADALTTGLPTVYGTLLLDPAVAFAWAIGSASRGRRMDAVLAVPNAPSLIGLSMAMQPLAPTSSAAIRFGDATAFVVGP